MNNASVQPFGPPVGPPLMSSPSRVWSGQLELEFTRRQAKTWLSRSRVQAPLKVQRPFYPEGEAICHSVMLHTAGGIVGGDELAVNLLVHPEAQALVTTAAATKVYRSNGATAQQTVHIDVAAGACLEWLPQETIVFNGALYRQRLQVNLAANARWLGWEVTRLGRSARGEQFQTGLWRSHIEVWQAGQLLWVDPQRVQGGSEMMHSPHGLAGCPVVGSLACLGQPISPELVEKARQLWQPGADATINATINATVGVTRLQSGLLCRYRGTSTAAARHWFIQVWQLLRQDSLGSTRRSACLPRVWQL